MRNVLSLYRKPVGCVCQCLGYRSWSTIPALLYERDPLCIVHTPPKPPGADQ